MIRRPLQNSYDYEDDRYNGPERRRSYMSPEEPIQQQQKPTSTPLPFWLQVAGFLFTLIASSVGTYMSLHDEQLRLSFELNELKKETSEANEVHNKTHEKIFGQIEKVSYQTQSIEDTITSLMQSNRKR